MLLISSSRDKSITCELNRDIDNLSRLVGAGDGASGILAPSFVVTWAFIGVSTDTALATVRVPLVLWGGSKKRTLQIKKLDCVLGCKLRSKLYEGFINMEMARV